MTNRLWFQIIGGLICCGCVNGIDELPADQAVTDQLKKPRVARKIAPGVAVKFKVGNQGHVVMREGTPTLRYLLYGWILSNAKLPIRSVELETKLTFSSGDKEPMSRKILVTGSHTSELVKGFLVPGIPTTRDVYAFDYPIDAQRRDLQYQVECIDYETFDPKEDLSKPLNLQAFILCNPVAEIIDQFKKRPELLKIKSESGASAVLWACMRNEPEILDSMLVLGADIKAKDKDGRNGWFYATFSKPVVAQRLLKAKIPVTKDKKGMVPYMMTYGIGSTEILNELLDAGCPLDALDPTGVGFIESLIKGSDFSTLKKLVKRGVNINKKNANGVGPLGLTGMYCRPEAMQMMLDLGADVNERNPKNKVPVVIDLYVAGQMEAVEFLINNGADLSVRDGNGKLIEDYIEMVESNPTDIGVFKYYFKQARTGRKMKYEEIFYEYTRQQEGKPL